MPNSTVPEIIAAIKQLSQTEQEELITACENEFHISISSYVLSMPTPTAEWLASQRTEYDIELTETGRQKLKVIKIIRDAFGFSLKETADLVDAAPAIIKKSVPKQEAEEWKGMLENVGARVTLR